MKRSLKILIIIVSVLIVGIASAYLYLRYMPEDSVSVKSTDYVIAAANLVNEYEANAQAADAKYIDRVLEVSGTIYEISTDQNNSTVIIIQDEEMGTGVLCTLTNESQKAAKKLKEGDVISIKGTCTGMVFEVVLNKCVIIEK